uniref:Tektin n=1 Tax=Panthera tigris altaica TaxID=74533 RepID=A0A8C9JIY7_PANTA
MAQTDVLLTKQPTPQTVPASELPRKLYDVARNTGAYTSSGLATAGFRSAQSLVAFIFQERDWGLAQSYPSKDQVLIWAFKGLTVGPYQPGHPQILTRGGGFLPQEAELIRNIQELLKRTIMQAVNQIRLNREHKETCEMDWSDKVEAYNIDQTCAHYHNQSTEVQFYPHSAKFEESASTPETWARFTQENLYRAERERLASVNLRVLIDSILRDTAEDLRLQCDAVNLAFERRCEEVEDARHKLTDHLHKTLREITDKEHNVAALKQAIKDKEAPLKVAQTRLYQRSHRPNVELCRDTAQFRLASEGEELNTSLAALKEKLLEAEQSLRNLEDTRMSLEKDIAVKTNSLFIDRHKCMAHRAHYPTTLQLAGYQ